MKIDPNAPAYPYVDAMTLQTGLPIRLELAARMMASPSLDVPSQISRSLEGRARAALVWADALIAVYNEGAK